ncbi:DNA repair protein rad52 [Coemansia sp. RSA 2320]|nr:DNA repair protein rad52 [Coemansia sp. RSA 2320]
MQQTQLHNRGGQSEDSSLSSFGKEEVLRIQSQLRQVLGPEHISTRQGSGNVRLSYIEGWRIISIANQIFGFDGWRSSIQSFSIDYVDQLEGGRLNVGASCMMRITLRDGTYKEDIGFGMIENAKSKGMAFEKVKKEAVTDAIKRAMRQFGNVLGNCVYDKEFVKSISQFPKQPRGRVQSEDLYRYSDLVSRDIGSHHGYQQQDGFRSAASALGGLNDSGPAAEAQSRIAPPESLDVTDRRSEGTVDFDMYDLDDDAFDGIGMMETDRPIIPESPTPRAYDHQPAPPTNVYNQQTTPARVDPASGPRWRPASAPVSHSNAAGNGPSPSPGGRVAQGSVPGSSSASAARNLFPKPPQPHPPRPAIPAQSPGVAMPANRRPSFAEASGFMSAAQATPPRQTRPTSSGNGSMPATNGRPPPR